MLVKFTANKKNQWDEFLDTCVFAYNTSQHESSCFTPFELMFGRKAALAIDIEMHKDAAENCLKRILNVGELSPSKVEQMAQLNTSTKQKQTSRWPSKNRKSYMIGNMPIRRCIRWVARSSKRILYGRKKRRKNGHQICGAFYHHKKTLVKACMHFSWLRTQIVSLIKQMGYTSSHI